MQSLWQIFTRYWQSSTDGMIEQIFCEKIARTCEKFITRLLILLTICWKLWISFRAVAKGHWISSRDIFKLPPTPHPPHKLPKGQRFVQHSEELKIPNKNPKNDLYFCKTNRDLIRVICLHPKSSNFATWASRSLTLPCSRWQHVCSHFVSKIYPGKFGHIL